jgi:hypothetical protein
MMGVDKMLGFLVLILTFWRDILLLSSGWWNYVWVDAGAEAGHNFVTLAEAPCSSRFSV